MEDKVTSKTRIVVVGGGGAGTSIVRGLVKVLDPAKHELIVIVARPQFVYLPGVLRILVDKDSPINQVFLTYDSLFDKFPGELKVGCVSSIDENKVGKGGRVILKTGEQIPYDVLAVATGSSWQGFLALPDEQALYEEHVKLWQSKFEKAQDIVIIGGGAVGIETAGEIKDVYPKKSVTIVQGGPHLMSSVYPMKFRTDLERRLRRRGVDIILDDTIEEPLHVDADSHITTRKGTTLTCDLLVTARGSTPNTSLFKFILPMPLENGNFVQVESTLQVRGHPSIFAAGDVVNVPEVKQFSKTANHAKIIVANIMSYLQGRPFTKHFKPEKEIIVVSVGKNGGSSYFDVFWGLQLGNIFTKFIKPKIASLVARNNLGLTNF